VGAQNVYWEAKGAFTGELSVPLVAEAGATHVLIGHSERRHIFGETDEQSAKKTVAVLAAGLTALVCVGETLAERESGRTEDAVRRQLEPVLDVVAPDDRSRFLVAYEPVWAIGTGRNATPTDAAQVHRFIRGRAGARGWPGRLRVLYGGSVNAGNALAILAEPDVDGVLVGGASLSPEGWAEIVGLG
jgi:triosephosphate isomerase